MKLIATSKSEQNRAVVDPWTVVHFAVGLAAGLTRIPLRRSLPAALAYEVAEQVLERHPAGRRLFATSGPESLPNVAMDVLAFVVGAKAGEAWNRSGEPPPRDAENGPPDNGLSKEQGPAT